MTNSSMQIQLKSLIDHPLTMNVQPYILQHMQNQKAPAEGKEN